METATAIEDLAGKVVVTIGLILFLAYLAYPYAKYIQSLDGFY